MAAFNRTIITPNLREISLSCCQYKFHAPIDQIHQGPRATFPEVSCCFYQGFTENLAVITCNACKVEIQVCRIKTYELFHTNLLAQFEKAFPVN